MMRYGTYDTVFSFIQSYQQSYQQSPSYSEIAEGCQISYKTAHKYVELLQEKGYLAHEIGKVRAIRILKRDDAVQ
jgi:SOS-response transcriptional repressor LexA